MFGFSKHLITALAALFTLGLIFAAPASAEAPGGFQPGGNGPDDPIVFVPDLVVTPVFPSATGVVSCNSETATVTVKNPTTSAFQTTIRVDGVAVDTNVTVGKNQQHTRTFPLEENTSKTVKVTRGAITMLDTELSRDCLKPAPAYEVLTNCDNEQAHARLINNGDDTAMMAIQYGEGTYAHQPVAPHSSKDWLLTVSPGESVNFHVVHSSTILGTENLSFDCPVDPPVVEPPVVEPPVEPPVVEPPVVEPPVEPPVVEPPVEPPVVEPPVVEPPVVDPETGGGDGTNGSTGGSTTDTNDTTDAGDTTDEGDTDEELDAEELDTEVLGEQLEISEIDGTTDLDELVGEVAGPTVAAVEVGTDAGMSFMKMALIGIWVLVIAAAGMVAVLINRRRADES